MKVAKESIEGKDLSWLESQPIDTKLELLKHHLELSRMLVNGVMSEEVCEKCGERYSRQKPHAGRYSRWGSNEGSVRLGEQRLPVSVPRIYDNEEENNVSLSSYQQLRSLGAVDEQLSKAVLHGLSMHDYGHVVETLLDSFGLSRSSISRDFVEKSTQKLEEFENRCLGENEYVALFIDGKYLAKEQIVIVLGVTLTGEKIPLGFIQTHTENAASIKALLTNLVERGLTYDDGLLCIIDGAKGIRKALVEVFGSKIVIQRCQWHKRENVLSYLNERDQVYFRKKLNRAYRSDSYNEAKEQLLELRDELKVKNISAARSLEEGLEETLTLHRLGLVDLFGKSFSTTNCIENLNSQLGKYIGKIKHWKTSDQRYRWVASALLEVEQRMRKVDNFKELHRMKEVVTEDIKPKRNDSILK